MREMPLILLVACYLIGCANYSQNRESSSDKRQSAALDLRSVSDQWKLNRHLGDFQVLKAHLTEGVSADKVEELLGEPDGWTQDDGKEYYEYVARNRKDGKSYTWNAIFSDRNLIKWAQ